MRKLIISVLILSSLALIFLQQEEVKADHGSEWHVSNVTMMQGWSNPSGVMAQWYQGGYGDCFASGGHNVCVFHASWWDVICDSICAWYDNGYGANTAHGVSATWHCQLPENYCGSYQVSLPTYSPSCWWYETVHVYAIGGMQETLDDDWSSNWEYVDC